MRRLPALLVLLVSVSSLSLSLLPVAQGASPNPLAFNGQASSDVKTQVTEASLDGVGHFGGATMVGSATALATGASPDLSLFSLSGTGAHAWDANDRDLTDTGAKLVRVANGTGGNAGGWVVMANKTSANLDLVSGYPTQGGCSTCDLAWQYNGTNGLINGLDVNLDGRLVAIASGTAATQNASYILIQPQVAGSAQPRELYRVNALSNSDPDIASVSKFTSVAISMNSTIPSAPDAGRAVVAVVGAETTLASGITAGEVFVFQSVFSGSDLGHPQSSVVQEVRTTNPVTSVDITADGEYAVAGTSGGQVYLISVGPALQRRGAGVNCPQDSPMNCLRPAQQSVGDAVTRVAIVKFAGGPMFAAGTQGGDVVLFRNDESPSGSEGAAAVEIRRGSVAGAGSGCTPQLQGPVASLSFTSFGEQLVVGAKNGLLQYDAGAFAQYGGDVFAPSWCIPFDGAHTGDAGVRAAVSGDGRRVFAGTAHFVFGYANFYHVSVQGGDEPQQGVPGGRSQWAITVANDGSLFDRLNLSIAGPTDPGWTFDMSNRSLLLLPGRSQTVLVNVTSPASTAPGNFTLAFSVNPEKASATPECQQVARACVVTKTLLLNVGQLRRVELRTGSDTFVATAGSENTFPVTVHNGGNAQDRFRVTARIPDPQEQNKSPGSDWQVRVDPSVVDVPGGQDATVNLVVTPSAQRGDFAVIELQVQPEVPSAGSEGVVDVKQVTVRVEPSFGGDIALADATKDLRLYPGQSIYVNFTVKNLGNSRDVFTVANKTDPANAPGWRLQLSDQRFELRTQGATHVVRMTVYGQQGLQPGDSVRAIVSLYSEGLAKQTPGSDGKVDEQSVTITIVPQPKAKFLGVPGFEPVLLLGGLGAALLARRRGA